MHKTRIDLPEQSRRSLADLLNARLADAIDLKLSAKHAHWNVKGPHFIALHELFDGLAAALDAPIDDMAERITALGGTADGAIHLVARRTSLDPYPAEIVSGAAHVEALANAVAAFGRNVRASIGEAGGRRPPRRSQAPRHARPRKRSPQGRGRATSCARRGGSRPRPCRPAP